jgi:hypothetical protein
MGFPQDQYSDADQHEGEQGADADQLARGGDRETPVTIVVTYGVRNRGCTLANAGGSKPSLAIAQKIRGWLMNMTSIAEVSAPIAAMPTMIESHGIPSTSTPTVTGWATFSRS